MTKYAWNQQVEVDVDRRVERWVEQRTGGQVHNLSVEHAGGRVIVHGQVGSYCVRHLARAAVIEALQALQLFERGPVQLDILVRP